MDCQLMAKRLKDIGDTLVRFFNASVSLFNASS